MDKRETKRIKRVKSVSKFHIEHKKIIVIFE